MQKTTRSRPAIWATPTKDEDMNLTRAVRKANLKKWKATPPAAFASPLKAIHAAYPDERLPGGGSRERFQYTEARRAAALGDGATVKRMAAQLEAA